MRISTRQIYTQGVEAFQQQQQKLAKLQEQISTGVRLSKPSDDPAAAAKVLELEESVSVNLQYQSNINLAEQRIGQQAAPGVIQRHTGLVTRGFQAQNQHRRYPTEEVPHDTGWVGAKPAAKPQKYHFGRLCKTSLIGLECAPFNGSG